MSRRNMRDYIHDAFFARDKASLAAIVKDAEEDIPPELLEKAKEHAEPDGDEGDKHSSAVHVHIEHGKATDSTDSVDGRLTRIEDTVKDLGTKMSTFFDSIKDGDLPPWLKKGGDDENGDDDTETKDEGELGGEEGAQSAEKLTGAEPDLMEADPALKTGPSKMGDAAYTKAVAREVGKLVQDTRARAESLHPGIKFPALDAAPRIETAKALCEMRRTTLTKAAGTERGRKLLGRFTPDAIKGLSCTAVRLAFLDASDRAREANNGQGRSQGTGTVDVRAFRQGQSEMLRTINERNRAHWEKQVGRPN
jgi:hypothetical protein